MKRLNEGSMIERLRARLTRSPLKTAITTAVLVGAFAILYVIFGALVSSEPGPMDTFARGEMRQFRTLDEPPTQPSMELTTGGGETIRLAEKKGKVLLVNFWATWCAPCVEEMPALDALQARYGGSQFEVVAVSMDQTFADARDFYTEHDLPHLALYHDPSLTAAFAARAPGLPVSVLYDRNGLEVGRLQGAADWASEDAFTLIKAAIERY